MSKLFSCVSHICGHSPVNANKICKLLCVRLKKAAGRRECAQRHRLQCNKFDYSHQTMSQRRRRASVLVSCSDTRTTSLSHRAMLYNCVCVDNAESFVMCMEYASTAFTAYTMRALLCQKRWEIVTYFRHSNWPVHNTSNARKWNLIWLLDERQRSTPDERTDKWIRRAHSAMWTEIARHTHTHMCRFAFFYLHFVLFDFSLACTNGRTRATSLCIFVAIAWHHAAMRHFNCKHSGWKQNDRKEQRTKYKMKNKIMNLPVVHESSLTEIFARFSHGTPHRP